MEDLILDPVKLLEMKERPLELSEALADAREKMMGAAELGFGVDLDGELQCPLRCGSSIFSPVQLEPEIGQVEERRRLARNVAGVSSQREALLVISGRLVEPAEALIDEPDVVEGLRFPEAAAGRASSLISARLLWLTQSCILRRVTRRPFNRHWKSVPRSTTCVA